MDVNAVTKAKAADDNDADDDDDEDQVDASVAPIAADLLPFLSCY